MEDQAGPLGPRRRVLDVCDDRHGSRRSKDRNRQNERPQREHPSSSAIAGALEGASGLKSIADQLRALGPMTVAIERIVKDAEERSTDLVNFWRRCQDELPTGR